MMTENEYLQAWLWYLFGASLLIACWWYLTRRIPWAEVRFMLRLVVAVVILVPWYSNTQQAYLSPAVLIAALELFFEGGSAFWRAGLPLLTAVVGALSLSTIAYTVRWYLQRKKTASAASTAADS